MGFLNMGANSWTPNTNANFLTYDPYNPYLWTQNVAPTAPTAGYQPYTLMDLANISNPINWDNTGNASEEETESKPTNSWGKTSGKSAMDDDHDSEKNEKANQHFGWEDEESWFGQASGYAQNPSFMDTFKTVSGAYKSYGPVFNGLLTGGPLGGIIGGMKMGLFGSPLNDPGWQGALKSIAGDNYDALAKSIQDDFGYTSKGGAINTFGESMKTMDSFSKTDKLTTTVGEERTINPAITGAIKSFNQVNATETMLGRVALETKYADTHFAKYSVVANAMPSLAYKTISSVYGTPAIAALDTYTFTEVFDSFNNITGILGFVDFLSTPTGKDFADKHTPGQMDESLAGIEAAHMMGLDAMMKNPTAYSALKDQLMGISSTGIGPDTTLDKAERDIAGELGAGPGISDTKGWQDAHTANDPENSSGGKDPGSTTGPSGNAGGDPDGESFGSEIL